jgi:peptide/nickel transport system substrate-binding protein
MIRPILRRVAAIAAAALVLTGGISGAANAATRTLTIGDISDPAPAKYDPVAYSDGQAVFFETLYDQLFVRTAPAAAKGVKGGLVTAHTLSDDKTTLTMTIRSGVKFTDGSTLDADTVKANLDRRNDTTLPSYSKFDKGGTQEITSVTVDGNKVVVKFKSAQPNAAYELSGPSGFIVSEKAAKDKNLLLSAPYGSGPYKLDAAKTIKANSYRFAKQASHWNKANYPYDVIVYKVYATTQAQANAAAAGQIDVVLQPATTSVPLLKARKVGLVAKPGVVYFMQWWDKLGKNYKFTEDKNVRLAFSYATDRNALVKGIFAGDRATASLVGKSALGYSELLDEKYTYNLAKAKQLLAASKYPNPEFTIVISANDASIHEALKTQWAKAGITMNIKIAANGGELFGAVRTGAMGIFSFDTSNLVGWTGLMLNSFPNYQGATNAKIGAALGALAADNKNSDKAEALNKAIVEEAWSLPLRESYSYLGYNKKTVKTMKIGANGNTWPLLTEIKPAK